MITYAIGDLQGCQEKTSALLQQIAQAPHFTGSTKSEPIRLIFVGDLVNRGPQSLAALRQVRALGERAEAVLGNHDLHLLAVAQGIRKAHASDTLDDVLNAPDRDELLDWLRRRPLALYENDHLVVHAGLMPQWSAEQSMTLAHEVETVLRGPDWVDFLREMYGNAPAKWDDALTGADRLRCIVNTLTRMRFCAADGTLDFSNKTAGDELTGGPTGFMPWFDVPGRKTGNVTVVFGHWSTLGLLLRPNLIGLDTGCVWGGKLTAVRLADRALFQVDCPQYQRPGPD